MRDLKELVNSLSFEIDGTLLTYFHFILKDYEKFSFKNYCLNCIKKIDHKQEYKEKQIIGEKFTHMLCSHCVIELNSENIVDCGICDKDHELKTI